MDNTVINELAERGKKRGSPLTGTEVLTALEGVDCEIEELENLCEELEKQGVFVDFDKSASITTRLSNLPPNSANALPYASLVAILSAIIIHLPVLSVPASSVPHQEPYRASLHCLP